MRSSASSAPGSEGRASASLTTASEKMCSRSYLASATSSSPEDVSASSITFTTCPVGVPVKPSGRGSVSTWIFTSLPPGTCQGLSRSMEAMVKKRLTGLRDFKAFFLRSRGRYNVLRAAQEGRQSKRYPCVRQPHRQVPCRPAACSRKRQGASRSPLAHLGHFQ